MESTENADKTPQTESVVKETSDETSAVKSTPVSVIQPTAGAAKVNGEEQSGDSPDKETAALPLADDKEQQATTNGTSESQGGEEPGQQIKEIQQPSEQIPAQLLQGDNSASSGVTTVGSLIEQQSAESNESTETNTERTAETASTTEVPSAAPATTTVAPSATSSAETAAGGANTPANTNNSNAKPTASDLAAEWEDEGGDVEMAEVGEQSTVTANEAKEGADKEPTAAENSADASEANDEETTPRKSGRKVKPTEKVLEGDNYVEESVEAIANELANSAQKKPKESEEDESKKGAAAAAGAGAASSNKKAGRPKKKDLDEKVDNVTKLGNNMYFYTGPGGQDSPPPLNSDDEGEGGEGGAASGRAGGKAAKEPPVEAARKSNRAGKGRNPRLEREDEEVEIPKKLPAKPNLNPSWLKDAAKAANADKKSPAKKKVGAAAVATPGTPAAAANTTPAVGAANTPTTKNESSSTAPSTPANNPTQEDPEKREKSPPKDEELPEFDPAKFTKGYVPKTVKKGEDEYVVIVQGVQDTGLCGKYWGDTNLPSRRRSKAPEQFKAGDSPTANRIRRGSSGSTGSAGAENTPGKQQPAGGAAAPAEAAGTPATPVAAAAKQPATANSTPAAQPKSNKKQVTKPETSKPAETGAAAADNTKSATENGEAATPADDKKKRGRKRKGDTPSGKEVEDDKKVKQEAKTPDTKAGSKSAAVSQALAAGSPAGQQRSVSCVADNSSQKEVVVECFAPYDDHRWVNIGKERDGMTPDAVQYARALRPPYHLLSFLRIKGHSTKGMSCTDKNTMVFVVLEGEITVILHTTQFNAKKGDSFYIPPKNYYNLINQKAREAELSLIQFQYDGPLPTPNQGAAAGSTAASGAGSAAATPAAAAGTPNAAASQ